MAESSELPGLDPVLDVVAEVAEAFVAAGHALYLVGGVVRDLLVDSFAAGGDIDLTTNAGPQQTKALVGPLASALWTQGERFGTIGATVNGRQIEITTHRAEAYEPVSRKPMVSYGSSIYEDLSRRDFTINAMAISLPDRAIFDPHDGRADLEAGVLRTPLSPEVSFTDDPLRMMRAARFLPRFDLEPEADLRQAACDLASRLAIVSVERVHDELERLLAVDDPRRGLIFLDETGLLVEILPALADLDSSAGTEAVELAAASRSVLARRAGLLTPLGPEAKEAMKRLRYSGANTSRTLKLIDAVEVTLQTDVTAETVRTVINTIGLAAIDDLAELSSAIGQRRQLASKQDAEPQNGEFFERLAQLSASEDLNDLAPPLSGGQIIEGMGMDPGPLVGQAVIFLGQERLRTGPMTKQQAYDVLAIWLQQQENKIRSQPGD